MTHEIMSFLVFVDRIATLPLCRNNSKLPSYFYRTGGSGGVSKTPQKCVSKVLGGIFRGGRVLNELGFHWYVFTQK